MKTELTFLTILGFILSASVEASYPIRSLDDFIPHFRAEVGVRIAGHMAITNEIARAQFVVKHERFLQKTLAKMRSKAMTNGDTKQVAKIDSIAARLKEEEFLRTALKTLAEVEKINDLPEQAITQMTPLKNSEIYESTSSVVHSEADEQWREATIHIWNCGSGKGKADVRWIPDRKAYEMRVSRGKTEIKRWFKESDVSWISLADGTIWKDYRRKNNQNNPSHHTAGSRATAQPPAAGER